MPESRSATRNAHAVPSYRARTESSFTRSLIPPRQLDPAETDLRGLNDRVSRKRARRASRLIATTPRSRPRNCSAQRHLDATVVASGCCACIAFGVHLRIPSTLTVPTRMQLQLLRQQQLTSKQERLRYRHPKLLRSERADRVVVRVTVRRQGTERQCPDTSPARSDASRTMKAVIA